jgi:predicted nucleic acid-binding protein
MRCFVDSNILVYAVQPYWPRKSQMARDLLTRRLMVDQILISGQVLSEFTNVAIKKMRMNSQDIQRTLIPFMALCEGIVPITSKLVQSAWALWEKTGVSWWDALIVQAALQANCQVLYSEDLHSGMDFGGLEVVNPFVSGMHEPQGVYA